MQVIFKRSKKKKKCSYKNSTACALKSLLRVQDYWLTYKKSFDCDFICTLATSVNLKAKKCRCCLVTTIYCIMIEGLTLLVNDSILPMKKKICLSSQYKVPLVCNGFYWSFFGTVQFAYSCLNLFIFCSALSSLLFSMQFSSPSCPSFLLNLICVKFSWTEK